MYVFTLLGYYYFDESYPNSDADCTSTWVCLITDIDRSYKNDGGLGGYMTPAKSVKKDDLSYFLARFFYDNF